MHHHAGKLPLLSHALCTRSFGSKTELVERLAQHFSVFSYDRRGRGDSGDTRPYAVEREIGDLDALIEMAGGAACVFGHSSGAALGLEAALRLGTRVPRLAMYEAPYNDHADARRCELSVHVHHGADAERRHTPRRLRTLEGQTHAVSPAALAPALVEFFSA
jgi:pimeloyl-ACP methyl ester carboxylesterase